MNTTAGGNQDIPYSFSKLFLYPIVEKFAPIFHSLNITPNQVTIFNIFFRMYIFYLFFKNVKSFYLLGLLILSNFFDALDGTLARKYNQGTELGAFLDHTSDKIFWGGLFLFIFFKSKNIYKKFIILFFILFFIYSIFLCSDKKKCFNENFLNMNSTILVIIMFFVYIK